MSSDAPGATVKVELSVGLVDAADPGRPLDWGLVDTITITPNPLGLVDPDAHVYSVSPGTTYRVEVTARRGIYLGGVVEFSAGMQDETVVVPIRQRTTILYITIDRPADAGDHTQNVAGLRAAARAMRPPLSVQTVDASDLLRMNLREFEQCYEAFMIFGAGSYTPFFWYGHDAAWKSVLDHYAELIKSMDIPMLAVCGSHQFLAIAYKGTSAVAHMEDDSQSAPITITEEIQAGRLKTPKKRAAEIGTYPIRPTNEAVASDPILAAIAQPMTFSEHHYDMVLESVVTAPFERILEPGSGAPSASPDLIPQTRCCVQGMRIVGFDRLLYCVQFHPEIDRFQESPVDDAGHGAQFLQAFFVRARHWWSNRP